MQNILGPQEKKKILMEYRLRLLVVSIFALAALIVASLVLLIPSYLLAVSKYNTAEKQLTTLQAKNDRNDQEKLISVELRDINNKIALLSSGDTVGQKSPTQVVFDILMLKNKEIKIFAITYDATPSMERMVLTGTALNRDSLAAFVETLKSDKSFTNVTLPISSYVKSTNIDFTLSADRNTKLVTKKSN